MKNSLFLFLTKTDPMGRMIRITLFIFLIPFGLQAQPEIEVSETSADFDGDSRNALSVMVYGEEHDEVEKKARKTFRGWGRVKNREAPLFVKEAEWDDLGEHPFDFYLKVEEQDDSTHKVLAAAYLGGAWLNSSDHGERYAALKERLHSFAVRVTKEALEGVVEQEQEKLEELTARMEELNDEKEDQKDEIEDQEETIEDAKETIEEAKKAIEEAEKRIEELKEKKSEQKEKVEAQKKEVEKVKEQKGAVE